MLTIAPFAEPTRRLLIPVPDRYNSFMEPQPENAIQIDDALKRQIEQLAQITGLSPGDLVREAVEAFISQRSPNGSQADSDALWDVAARISESVRDSEWEKLPVDLARNFDHYHYGHPRVE